MLKVSLCWLRTQFAIDAGRPGRELSNALGMQGLTRVFTFMLATKRNDATLEMKQQMRLQQLQFKLIGSAWFLSLGGRSLKDHVWTIIVTYREGIVPAGSSREERGREHHHTTHGQDPAVFPRNQYFGTGSSCLDRLNSTRDITSKHVWPLKDLDNVLIGDDARLTRACCQ